MPVVTPLFPVSNEQRWAPAPGKVHNRTKMVEPQCIEAGSPLDRQLFLGGFGYVLQHSQFTITFSLLNRPEP